MRRYRPSIPPEWIEGADIGDLLCESYVGNRLKVNEESSDKEK